MTVTFFGHRNTPDSIQPALKKTLIQLIEKALAEDRGKRVINLYKAGNQNHRFNRWFAPPL